MTYPEQPEIPAAPYKFPMWKLFLFLGALVAGYAFVSTYDAVAHPTIAANLAVDQLDDTEGSAIAMRSYDRVQNFLPLGLLGTTLFFGLYLVFGAALFRADLVRLITRLSENLTS